LSGNKELSQTPNFCCSISAFKEHNQFKNFKKTLYFLKIYILPALLESNTMMVTIIKNKGQKHMH